MGSKSEQVGPTEGAWVDLLLSEVSHAGNYQKVLVASLCLCSTIMSMATIQAVFVTSVPEWSDDYCEMVDRTRGRLEPHNRVTIPNSWNPKDIVLVDEGDGDSGVDVVPIGGDGKIRFDGYGFPPFQTEAVHANLTMDLQSVYNNSSIIAANFTSSDNWEETELSAKCRIVVWHQEEHFRSLVTDFGLTEDDIIETKFVELFLLSGVFLGAFSLGMLSDTMGRRPALMLATAMTLVGGVSSAFAPDIVILYPFQFAHGLGAGGLTSVGYSLCVEMVGGSSRVWVSAIFKGFFFTGVLAVDLAAYCCENWRQLLLASSLPSALLFFLYFLVPESPRWLLGQKRWTEAETILLRIARNNGKEWTTMCTDTLNTIKELAPKAGSETAQAERHVSSLWRYAALRRRSTVMLIVGFAAGLANYLFIIAAQDFGDSLYLTELLLAIFKLMGSVLAVPALYKFGCRVTICTSSGLCAASCFAIFCTHSHPNTLHTCLAAIGMMVVSINHIAIFLYTAELYPTAIRATAVGITAGAFWAGGASSPLVSLLYDLYRNLDFALCGAVTLAATILVCLLPDTQGMALPETVAEMIQSEEDNSVCEFDCCAGDCWYRYQTKRREKCKKVSHQSTERSPLADAVQAFSKGTNKSR